jgi:hypothetical protein
MHGIVLKLERKDGTNRWVHKFQQFYAIDSTTLLFYKCVTFHKHIILLLSCLKQHLKLQTSIANNFKSYKYACHNVQNKKDNEALSKIYRKQKCQTQKEEYNMFIWIHQLKRCYQWSYSWNILTITIPCSSLVWNIHYYEWLGVSHINKHFNINKVCKWYLIQ